LEGSLVNEYRVEGISVGSEFSGDPTDSILDILDASGVAVDAVASASESLALVSAMFTLDAASVEEATERGTALLRKAFSDAGIEQLSKISVEDAETIRMLELLDREVSGTEVARATGLSRERVRQLCEMSSFPAPVRRLGRSALWRWRDIAEFFTRRGTRLEPSRLDVSFSSPAEHAQRPGAASARSTAVRRT
jgi:predicted DNA-binding transcriptional regulator AlpA